MLARLYQTIIRARNSFYDSGVFASHSLGAFTVSIGNITVGGTGKTPLVARVAEILAGNGERVCILTRGYGRENPRKRILVSDGETIFADVKTAGDEPFELARKLAGNAVIVADANRAAAGAFAREKFGITAFVLDDAFQHRRVRRGLDIVLIDATNPFGSGKTLPSGILREPLENLKRADAIVITRANLTENIAGLKSQIAKYNPRCLIFVSANKFARLTELESFHAGTKASAAGSKQPTTGKVLAFCALGNPNNFFEQLRREKFSVAAEQKFPDHHFYAQSDIAKLVEKAGRNGAAMLVTTAKDAVKLRNLKFALPCFVAETDLVFDGGDEFKDWILATKKSQ